MVKNCVEQEKNFNILKNASGDLMILIRARLDDVVAPKVVYSGGEHALLYRSDDHAVVLDFIHPSVRSDLTQAPALLVVEARDGAIIREYMAEVKHLRDLPLPDGLVLN